MDILLVKITMMLKGIVEWMKKNVDDDELKLLLKWASTE